MIRCRRMRLRPLASALLLLSLLASWPTFVHAGPIGSFDNTTIVQTNETEKCVEGSREYAVGERVSRSEEPCAACRCGAGGRVQCSREKCAPRPGCRAVHEPGRCCPTYRCECEADGRLYGNGEKLLDPADPCRVCYCQGGEVVCRRIACFLRDDCRPKLVPGRCCPEYDNCPIRGVTSAPEVVSSDIAMPVPQEAKNLTENVPEQPKLSIRQQITIKEITPVSEIPAITEVKIKEILPSSNVDMSDFSSSKSPMQPREVSTERDPSTAETNKVDSISDAAMPTNSLASIETTSKPIIDINDSKVSVSFDGPLPAVVSHQETQDKDGNSKETQIIISPSPSHEDIEHISSEKPTFIEDEEQLMFDHNPAFPPIPDDLSLVHVDEIQLEQSSDADHQQPEFVFSSSYTEPDAILMSSTIKSPLEPNATDKSDIPYEVSDFTSKDELTSQAPQKNSPMLNLRSVIDTDLLNLPAQVKEIITSEFDYFDETSTTPSDDNSAKTESEPPAQTPTEKLLQQPDIESTEEPLQFHKTPESTILTLVDYTTEYNEVSSATSLNNKITSENPELISLSYSENTSMSKQSLDAKSTVTMPPPTIMNLISSTPLIESEINESSENAITMDPIRINSSESTLSSIELLATPKIEDKSEKLIKSHKNDVFNDLISIVGDVASIGDHTDEPETTQKQLTVSPSLPDSEELIPVNIGHKSKNNNNPNSITEVPFKTKNLGHKMKVVEIEDDESDSITDSPPPFDRAEPTTRRPLIDNVTEGAALHNDTTVKTDIEIITRSYVPTIGRRPTKVLMGPENNIPPHDSRKLDASSSATPTISTTTLLATPVTRRAVSKVDSN